MWYRGSLGELENIRRTTGAASARPRFRVSPGSPLISFGYHTFCFTTSLVNARANDHDIVDDGKTALASDPVALFVFDTAICQYRSIVHHDLLLVKLLSVGYFILVEELPRGSIDNFIWCVAQDVNHRV